MKKRINTLIIINLIFYILLNMHRIAMGKYGDDILLQTLFYMMLAFSTAVVELAFRGNLKKIKLLATVDMVLRVVAVVLSFTTIVLKLNPVLINIIMVLLFISNLILEIIIRNRIKNKNYEEEKLLDNKALEELMTNFRENKINYLKTGVPFKEDLGKVIKGAELSGVCTILLGVMSFLIFVASFIFDNFKSYGIIPVAIIIILFIVNLNVNYKMLNLMFGDEGSIKKRFIKENATLLIGLLVIFIAEFIINKYASLFFMTFCLIATLFLLPTLLTKYEIRKKINSLYEKYHESLEDM